MKVVKASRHSNLPARLKKKILHKINDRDYFLLLLCCFIIQNYQSFKKDKGVFDLQQGK